MPQCLQFADEHAFHEEDFSIDCNSGSYMLTLALSFVAIVLVPIGVPAIFLYYMKQAKDALGGANQTALGGAKLVPDEIDDDEDPFGYLIRDCKPECYCETRHLTRCLLNVVELAVCYIIAVLFCADYEIVTYSR